MLPSAGTVDGTMPEKIKHLVFATSLIAFWQFWP